MIDILEKSELKIDRQLYVRKMKEYIQGAEELLGREMQYIKNLKAKISEYDIFNQQKPYDTETITNPTSDSAGALRNGIIEEGTELRKSGNVENNGRRIGTTDNEIDTSDIPDFS